MLLGLGTRVSVSAFQCLDLLQDREEAPAELGEAVLDMQLSAWKLRLLEHAICHEFAQALVEHFRGDARNRSFELTRTGDAIMNRSQDAPGPFASQHLFKQRSDAVGG